VTKKARRREDRTSVALIWGCEKREMLTDPLPEVAGGGLIESGRFEKGGATARG